MHYSRLKAYLDLVMPAQQVATLLEAFELLLSAGIDGHDYTLEQEMALAENADSSMFCQSVYNLAHDSVIDCINKLGIQVPIEISLFDAVDIFRGLMALDNYGDPESIIQSCTNDEGSEEALAEILTFVGRGSVAHYVHFFHHVDPKLLERLEESMQSQLAQLPADDLPGVQRARERLKAFRATQSAKEPLVVLDVFQGTRLGADFSSYLENHLEALEKLGESDPANAAVQVYAMALASNRADAEIPALCAAELEALIPDITKLTKAQKSLSSLLSE